MKRGSIKLARRLCVEIAGLTDPDDLDGNGYGSVDVAEILSAEVERLRDKCNRLFLVGEQMANIVFHWSEPQQQRISNAPTLAMLKELQLEWDELVKSTSRL